MAVTLAGSTQSHSASATSGAITINGNGTDYGVAWLFTGYSPGTVTPPAGWTLVSTEAPGAGMHVRTYIYSNLGSVGVETWSWTTALEYALIGAVVRDASANTGIYTTNSASTFQVTCGTIDVGTGGLYLVAVATPDSYAAMNDFNEAYTQAAYTAVNNSSFLYTLGETAESGFLGEFGGDINRNWAASAVGFTFNVAPNAPTLTSPINDVLLDAGFTGNPTVNLQGTFSDPDAGDTLSGVIVEYDTQAGGSPTTLSEQAASGTTFSVAVSFAPGEWRWRARTRDAGGELGPYSGYQNFKVGRRVSQGTLQSFGTEWKVRESGVFVPAFIPVI